jgi:hypothetical protein
LCCLRLQGEEIAEYQKKIVDLEKKLAEQAALVSGYHVQVVNSIMFLEISLRVQLARTCL